MTRQISSAVCRNPEVYKEVCENILRVDISCLKSEFQLIPRGILYVVHYYEIRMFLAISFPNNTFIVSQRMTLTIG